MTASLKFSCFCIFFSFAGCSNLGFYSTWKGAVTHEVNRLGNDNWIVVAEASFPSHSRPGVRLITTDAEIPKVVDFVVNSLETTQYVRPKIYQARELRSIEDDFAPGVKTLQNQIEVALHGHEPTEIDQQSLLTLLESANQNFEVLVIRTSTALPYSSVFFELQSGYWDAHSEKLLRRRISREATESLAPPES